MARGSSKREEEMDRARRREREGTVALEGGAAPEEGTKGRGEEESSRRLNRARILRYGRRGTNNDQGSPLGTPSGDGGRPIDQLYGPSDDNPTAERSLSTCPTRLDTLSTSL